MAAKLERLNEYVLIVTVMVVGTLLAIFSGRLSGAGDSSMLIKIVSVVGSTFVCLAMRTRVWMLIPMFWVMSDQLNSVPGHLPMRDLVVALVLVSFFMLKAFKMIKTRPRYDWLDFLLIINLLYLLSAFVRNPVGVNVFGSEVVGGRPYLEVIFALAGYWVINQVVMTPKQAWRLPFLFVAVSTFLALLNAVTYMFPALAPILGRFYGGVNVQSLKQEESGNGDNGEDRIQFLSGVGSTMINIMASYFSPLTMINPMYFLRFALTVTALIFCLKSGHRLTVPGIAATFLLATYFRKGVGGVFVICLLGAPALAILVALQGHGINLPESAQRTLSFLPGKWDRDVVSDAEGSSQWRFDMWKIVMSERQFIDNKTFGDGFHFTRSDMEEMAAKGTPEDFMRVGDVHSGPISAIRAVGYVGLSLYIILFGGVVIRSYHLIRAAKGTLFFPCALAVGVPAIYGFFGFIFIFGDFGKDIPNLIMTIGWLKLLSNGMIEARRKAEQPDPQLPDRPPGLDSINQPGPIPVMLR